MKRLPTLVTALSFGFAACGASDTPSTPVVEAPVAETPVAEAPMNEAQETPMPLPPVSPGELAADLPSAIDALGVDLYRQVRRSGNFVFSPASISLAFGMTWAGAAGETSDEMKSVLRYPSATVHRDAQRLLARWNGPHPGLTLRVVDRLFAEQTYTFEAPFLALARDRYAAPVERVDFMGAAPAQRQRINAWVAEQTENRIDELLPPGVPDATARLVLVNAVYFLGEWVHQFDANNTRPGSFASPTGSVEAQLMRQTSRFRFGETDDAQILEMPYQGGAYAMTIVLPKQRDGLDALETSMDVDRFAEWRGAMSEERVEVILPRFTIDGSKLDLGQVLQALGMRLAFSPGAADFTNMARPANPADELYIAAAVHEAFIEVGEDGTEAAAATAVVMATRGMAMPVEPAPVFRADHPFLFTIRDTETNTTLFLGRVVDPS